MADRRRSSGGTALKRLLICAALSWSCPAAADPIDRWAAPIAEASARFGIPADWIRRVMRIESGGRTTLGAQPMPIVSRAGAMGLMQLMPGTWREVRALLGLGIDPHDPRDNILAGSFYLRLMYDRFGYPGLFAAYNAGPARYGAALAGRRPLPAETRSYLSSAIGAQPRTPIVQPRAPMRLALAPKPAARALFAAAYPEGRSNPLFVQLRTAPR